MHNMEAVSKKKLVVIGKMLATCVAQGGVAPLCFARAVADYLVFGEIKTSPCIEDTPGYEIQQKLRQV
jgi:hypothetical protein